MRTTRGDRDRGKGNVGEQARTTASIDQESCGKHAQSWDCAARARPHNPFAAHLVCVFPSGEGSWGGRVRVVLLLLLGGVELVSGFFNALSLHLHTLHREGNRLGRTQTLPLTISPINPAPVGQKKNEARKQQREKANALGT